MSAGTHHHTEIPTVQTTAEPESDLTTQGDIAAHHETGTTTTETYHIAGYHENTDTTIPPVPSVGQPPPLAEATQRGVKRTAEEADDTIHSVSDAAAIALAKKKRLCRHAGCCRVIKSQGLCQKHGAKAKRCKVEGCEKQAQGTHDGRVHTSG